MSTATPLAVLLVQVLPPIRARASSTITCLPAELRSAAAASPAIPAPMTITSAVVCREPNVLTVLFKMANEASRAAETRLSLVRALAGATLEHVKSDEMNAAMIWIRDNLFLYVNNVSQCAGHKLEPGNGTLCRTPLNTTANVRTRGRASADSGTNVQ